MYGSEHIFSFSIQDGVGPLSIASQCGKTEVVNALLENGADPSLACMVWVLLRSFHVYCVPIHCPITEQLAIRSSCHVSTVACC